MIEATNLVKEYGNHTAVDGNTFSVSAGDIFGIIGPNGAGKTTTLKMLSGLVEPTRGTVQLNGADPARPETRTELGYLPEESPLYENMTAWEYLLFFADLYDVDTPTARTRIESTLDTLNLEHRDRKLGDVSKGMKRKVAIARSLVNDPAVIVYDEPASGLDPLTTHKVLEFIEQLADEGKTVIFSAHNLHHVEDLCDEIAIMNEGDIIAQGTIEELRTTHGTVTYRLYASIPLADSVETEDGYLVEVESVETLQQLQDEVASQGGDVLDIRTIEPSLEELFLSVAQSSPDTSTLSTRQKREGAIEPGAHERPTDSNVETDDTDSNVEAGEPVESSQE